MTTNELTELERAVVEAAIRMRHATMNWRAEGNRSQIEEFDDLLDDLYVARAAKGDTNDR